MSYPCSRCGSKLVGKGTCLRCPQCNPIAPPVIPPCGETSCETVAAIRQQLAEANARQQWRPIETAPRDGTLILFYDPKRNLRTVGYWHVYMFGECQEWRTLFTSAMFNPTHWMPLPTPPKELACH